MRYDWVIEPDDRNSTLARLTAIVRLDRLGNEERDSAAEILEAVSSRHIQDIEELDGMLVEGYGTYSTKQYPDGLVYNIAKVEHMFYMVDGMTVKELAAVLAKHSDDGKKYSVSVVKK